MSKEAVVRTATEQPLNSWAWVVAAALCVVGWAGITPLGDSMPAQSYVLVGFPHALLVGVAVWAGRIDAFAVGVAVTGCGLAAGLPWLEWANRRTSGYEWEYGNVMQWMTCCASGYVVLGFATVGVLAAADARGVTTGEGA